MLSDLALTTQFEKRLKASQSGLSKQYENTRQCHAFYAGDMMAYQDNIQFTDPTGKKKRALVQFNKVKPYVNAVKGFMAQNRRQVKYIARIEAEPVRRLFSQYSNALAGYIRDGCNADQVETQQDGDMLTVGYGAIETAMTYGDGYATTNPNGQVIKGRLDPLLVGWDHQARQTNLLDARWVYYLKQYGLKDALALFADSEEEDFERGGADATGRDEGFQFFQNGGRYNQIKELGGVDWADQANEMVNIYFYQWHEFEDFYRADNPIYSLTNPQAVQLAAMQLDALAQEFGDDRDDMFAFDPRAEILTFGKDLKKKLLEHFGEFIQVFSYKRKIYYTAVISGKTIFTRFKSHCQDGFSIKFKTGDFDSKNKIWMGMVNSMKEPMLYYNKALTELMFIIGSNSKGGVYVERGAVQDIADFEQKYARTDAVIVVEDGVNSTGRIKPKKEPFMPSGYENIVQLCDASINDVVGIDKTFLGSSENKEETGVLQKRRIKQVVPALACWFDSITLRQREEAGALLVWMRIYAQNNDGSMFRVTGEDGKDQFLKISADKLTAEYDVTLQEAPQSADEKQEYAQIMQLIGDKLLMAGDAPSAKAIYAIAIRNLPFDPADIQKVIQILTPDTQQVDPAYVKQLQDQVQQLMSEIQQAQTADIAAAAKKKLSEVALNAAKLDATAAQTHKTLADAQKATQEAVRTHLEAGLIQQGKETSVDVRI